MLALAQTGDGTLWIGTDLGPLQFDGVRFRPFRPSSMPRLAGESIAALAPAPDGSLWIGTRQGLSHWKQSKLDNYPTGSGPAAPHVTSILVDHAGTVWVGMAGYRSGALCRLETSGLRCDRSADEVPALGVFSLFQDRRKSLWVGGVELCRWTPGKVVYPRTAARRMVYSVVEDREGTIWAADGQLERLQDGRLVPYPIPVAGKQPQPIVLLSDRDGGLWIGTGGQGLLHLYRGRIDRFTEADGLSSDVVRALLEDREGNIWTATNGGLDRFRQYKVTTLSKRDGINENLATSVLASRDGSVWIGTMSGLNQVKDGKIIRDRQSNGLPSPGIIGLFEEQAGRLWVLTVAGLAYREQGRFRPLRFAPESKIQFIAAAEDREHSVWLSDPEHGLLRLEQARVVQTVPWSQFNNRPAWALEPDPRDGGLWLGFASGTVGWYKTGQPIRWYETGSEAVTDLHVARDNALWIATQGGLRRLHNGRLATLAANNGLPCDRLRALVEDDRGDLWLNADCGLVRISAADLASWSSNPAVQIHPRVFDATDGMRRGPAASAYFRRAVKSADGRLWFALLNGVAMVDPNHLPFNGIAPPVRIEGITAGEVTYSVRPGLRLPPLVKELRIDYTAMSFVAPDKVRFRYRLEGFDNRWNEAAGRRQAVYTNLPPKHYKFHVIACNNDGVWNEAGATYEFSIAPALYQASWFRLLCAAAFSLLIWTAHRLRLRRLSAQLNARHQERIAERTRIAREMHDTLLQNICGFSLQVQALSKNADVPETARNRLVEIRRDAEQCLRQAREFVWDLRAPTLDEVDLPEALREAGEKITSGEPVQFHMTVRGNPRPAPARLQQQLLRIVQEATRNAVRNGHAREIEMQIVYLDTDSIRLRMRDNGCGFDLEQASGKAGHWGLTTMRERAQQIGAELKISSAPGQGTELEIVAPIASP